MSEQSKSDERPNRPRVRRPYLAPRIMREASFETLAMACGKLPAEGGNCIVNPRSN